MQTAKNFSDDDFEKNENIAEEATVNIRAKMDKPLMEIGYTFEGTGERNIVKITNGKAAMMLGRLYYIPISNTEIDSDDFRIIKVFSDVADKFDIKFVKDGYVCIKPLVHNIHIVDGQKLCTLIR